MPNTGDSGIISKLRFYITKTGVPGTEFRAKLYSVDPETKGPGELLLENELIAGAKKGNEWVEFDITAYHIEIPAEGFFVAMQWLPGAQEYSLDLGKTTYTGEGQVLGLSKETPQKFWIKPFPADWIESFTVPDIIPMIGADVLVKCK